MSFCSFSKDNISSGKTLVDNVFLTNYLPDAPSDAIKVYLYGLFLCKSGDDDSISTLAEKLSMTEFEVKDYFKYWEEYGLVNIACESPFSVIYYPIGENENKYKRFKPEKYQDFSKEIQGIITARMISVNEYSSYYQLMENSTLKPEALLMLVKYCVDTKGENINYKYITTVAKDFINRGITTCELVEKELSGYFSATKEVSQIFTALSIKKSPEIDDIQLFKKWTNKYDLEISYILQIVKLSKCKNVKKLDAVIEELYSNKCYTVDDAEIYFKNKEKLYKLSADINRALGIFIEVLDNEILTYVSPWTSMGYDEESLIFIANYCFKKNKRNLESMNEIVNNLYKKGLISIANIVSFIEKRAKDDKFISEILSVVGVSRRPNDWDRKNLKIWRGWNFTDQMILEGAKRSVGVNNYVPYLSSVLSNWKNKGIFKVEDIVDGFKQSSKKSNVSHFENERTYSKEELDKLLTSIEDLEV